MRNLIIISLALTTPALADDAPDTIVVTASRSPQPLARVGQSITVIDNAEITRRQSQTVAELLRTVPGVAIVRNGTLGGTASVFIRGADGDQTVALIDGVKLNDPAAPGGGFNFGNLLIGNIDRIEVLRGPSSVIWGSQAIGGVVSMITRAPTQDLTLNARGEYGWRNTAQAVANLSGKAGPLSASIGGGYFRTDGVSAFAESRGGTERDGFENYGANANLNLALTDAISIDARAWYSDSEADLDGFPPPNFNFADSPDTTRTRELVAYTGLNAALFDGKLQNRLGFAYTDTDRGNFDQTSQTFASQGRNERLEYQGILTLSDAVQSTFGAERETSRYATDDGFSTAQASARIDSVYGQLSLTPTQGLTLTGGIRQDDHNRFGGATSLAGSGVWQLGNTILRASYTQGFKAPSLFQLYSDFGNARLQPERSKGWDAGITQSTPDGRFEASATWFSRNTTNLIDFIGCPLPRTGICTDRPFGTYNNVARARSQGIEITLALKPTSTLNLQANYTWTDARNRSPGNANFDRKLIRRPEHSLNTLIDWQITDRIGTGLTLTHIGRTFINAANTQRLAGYVLADLRVSFALTEQVALYARVENLFDEQYETVRDYGQPGRAAHAGVRVKL